MQGALTYLGTVAGQSVFRSDDMQCPTCPDQPLRMSERQGIEIGHCPHCHGVWLGRGALDEIIERAGAGARVASRVAPSSTQPASVEPTSVQHGVAVRHGDTRHLGQRHRRMPGYRARGRDSFLADLFDI